MLRELRAEDGSCRLVAPPRRNAASARRERRLGPSGAPPRAPFHATGQPSVSPACADRVLQGPP
jgi:hypothetical protein